MRIRINNTGHNCAQLDFFPLLDKESGDGYRPCDPRIFDQKRKEKNLSCIFILFLVIKTLDPDLNSLEMLDADPDTRDPDQQHWA